MKNKKIINHKKGQITIFLIVGLVIVIGVAVFFYSTQKVQKPLEPELKIIQEQVPLEFEPIKKYANDCAYSAGVESLRIIGKQGGYISFADKTLNNEPFTITQNPTESDAVSFTKDSDLKTAYWWHLKSANNCKGDCKFASKRPDLRQTDNSIEKQLERYIDLKFKECLNNFEPFLEEGFKVIEAGKIKTDVTIGSDDILVLIEYPLSIESQGTNTKLSQFLVRIPINLDKIYDLATKITNIEIKHRYLEKHILNLIVAFSGVNKEKLPPMSDMQFKFGSTTSWQKTDVKSKITGLLTAYIPLFQVDGTYNYERNLFDSELKQRLYDSTIIPVANSSFKDIAAYFTYLDFWPAYFDLNCKGEKCVPASANSLISFFGIQNYRFTYDLSFPVLVEIQDPFALNGQGYSFNFFLEGNIRNNKPMPADFAPLERADLSESSLLCDTRTSGNISVNIVNAATKKPVDDAQILYTIIDESCFIGSTDANGVLIEKFPVAIGGVVNIVKEGYIGKAVEFDPKANNNAELKVRVQPIYTKKLIVKKKDVVKTPQGWQFADAPVELNNKESATITLTRINDEGELGFSSFANYEWQQNGTSEIEIAPGNYAVDATLMLDERIIIPEKQKCIRKGIFGEKECFAIPKVDFGEKSSPGQERFPEGGLKLNLTINPNELEKHDTIVFYVVSTGISKVPEQERVIEDIEQMGKIEEYSSIYQLALQPTFEK
ncbi:hypothetical protein HYX00_02325 [Candidatus Woesearchaeota archaeon]|nr:hypothetical protein [Candidatus Woesearchaeota archaeon]